MDDHVVTDGELTFVDERGQVVRQVPIANSLPAEGKLLRVRGSLAKSETALPQGDILLKWDDREIVSAAEMDARMAELPRGDVEPLVAVWRRDRVVTVRLNRNVDGIGDIEEVTCGFKSEDGSIVFTIVPVSR